MRRGLSIFTRFALQAALFILAASAVSAQSGTTMYGVTGVGGSASDLYTINKTNAQATFIGPTGYNGISSLDFAPDGTTLLAIANGGSVRQPVSLLISIDRSTGVGTTIGPTGLTINVGTPNQSTRNIPDIAVRSDGLIFGVDGQGLAYTFNPTTGAATVLGSLGLSGFPGGGGVAFSSGTLYLCVIASGQTDLYTVNQTTGAATQVATVDFSALPAGADRLAGMKFDPTSGLLYATAFVNIDPADTTRIVSATVGGATLSLNVVGDPGVVFEAVAFGAAPVAQFTMYGVDGAGGFAGNLLTIDKSNAQTSLVGFSGWYSVSSLDSAPDGKSLYAIANSSEGNPTQTLVNIDQSTGIGIPIGPTGLTDNISDIAVRPDGVIFGIDSQAGVLYKFSPTTGTATSVGSLGLAPPVGGGALAFSPKGTLYLAGFTGGSGGSSHLYTVNQTSGAATQVANIDFSAVSGADRFAGMKFDPVSGLLYGTAIVPAISVDFAPTSHIMRGTVGGAILVLTDVGDAGDAFEALAFGPPPEQATILPATLPVGTINVPYLHYLVCNFCDGFAWSFGGGTPPPGLTLVSQNDDALPFYGTGVLSGTPTQAGTFTFTVVATDYGTTQNYTMYVRLGPLSVVQAPLPNGAIGTPYSFTFTKTGGVPPNFTWTLVGSPPPGLSINSSTGQLTGVPTTGGSFPVNVMVSDVSGASATGSFTLNVVSTLSITTTALPGAVVGVPYTTTVAASGGFPPLAWSLPSANINGLTINSSTGVISGTPVFGGTLSPFTVIVKDSQNTQFSKNFTLRTLAISTTSLPDGKVGVAYGATLGAFGASPSIAWSVTSGSSLPPGLTLNSSGVVSGTPTTVGTFPFSVTATDVQGSTSRALLVNINPGFGISTSTLPDGAVGTAYAASVQSVNGNGAVIFKVTAGLLPTGLTLGSGGTISGTPTTAGLANFTVTATDSTGATASKALSINVAPAPVTLTITTGSLPNGLLGSAYSSTLAASLPSTWSFVIGTLPAGLNLNASTGAITGTPTALGATTFTVKAQSGAATAQKQFTITITTAPAVTVNGLPSTSGPGQQPAASVVLSGIHALTVNGNMTLTFAATGGGDNPEVRFANGIRTANFTVPAGSTNGTIGGAPNIGVLTGTVAGTITITLTASDTDGNTIPPGAPITIAVTPTVPFISSVKLVTVSGGFNVVVTGFSSTKNMVSGLFHFTPTTGNTISPADVTVQLASVFSAWYASAASNAIGSQFLLTVPFTTQGNTTFPVATVTVTLTNSQGASNPVTSN